MFVDKALVFRGKNVHVFFVLTSFLAVLSVAISFGEDSVKSSSPSGIVTKPPLAIEKTARIWRDAARRYNTEATLETVGPDTAVLRRIDNEKLIEVPINKLSESDQVYISQITSNRVDVAAKVILGKVVDVLDGDTLRVANALESVKTIRLNGIDAPEKSQPFGKDAIMFLNAQARDRHVRVEYKEIDNYQRILGDVYLEDVHLNLTILENGFGWHYTKYSNAPELAAAEQRSRLKGAGLWAHADSIAPWDWRDGKRTPPTDVIKTEPVVKPTEPATPGDYTVYITKTGRHYHAANCRHVSKSRIPIPFSRAESAYLPCEHCTPHP